MDQTDKRILARLGKDGRISFTALGREIGLSRTAIQDRVTKLETNGVIRGYHADYSQNQVGIIHALIFIKIAVRPCDQALNWLASLNGVHKVTSISGEIDAIAHCVVTAPYDLTLLNDTIGASNLITKSTSSLVLGTRK
ncbi:MAG: Lrp/AsnC family transcriptional regulator [Pseudoruegeria sp.]